MVDERRFVRSIVVDVPTLTHGIAAEKKEFLVRARYDALAAEGGKRAVKKAIEKKQKKIGQKEKRSRPFAKGSASLKRTSGDGEGGPPAKRRRL